MLQNHVSLDQSPGKFAKTYFNYLHQILISISETEISSFVETLLAARERDSTIFFIGNGGSAATASHFANDIGIGTRSWNKPFKAVSLTDNNAVMTAIGNDYGYQDIFTKQLQIQLRSGDVVVAISASGNSINLINAMEYANQMGGISVGLTAFDGGRLKEVCAKGIHVPCHKGEYGPAEDAHMIIDHLVHAYLTVVIKSETEMSV